MDIVQFFMTLLSTLLFIAAIFFSFMLARETKGEKYWFFFLVAALSMAVFHGARHPWALELVSTGLVELIQEIAEIVGAFSLAYACYGLYTSMKRIREKVGEEL